MADMQPHWDQIICGIDTIVWSKLARWDLQQTNLVAETDEKSFEAYCSSVNSRSGRWLCWIAFCVGAESLLKGAVGLKGYKMGNLGACHPWKKWFSMTPEEVGTVATGVCELAQVRNRDAHYYVRGQRKLNFPSVKTDFVPALNLVISHVDKGHLAAHYLSNSESSHT